MDAFFVYPGVAGVTLDGRLVVFAWSRAYSTRIFSGGGAGVEFYIS